MAPYRHELTTTGTYQIVCRDVGDNDSGGCGLTLIEYPGPNLVKAGEFGDITHAQTREGSIGVQLDLDVYEVEAIAGDSLGITMAFTSGFAQARFDLWMPEGTLVERGMGGAQADAEFPCVQQIGPYLIICRDGLDDETGEYTLTLRQQPGPPPPDAPPEYLQLLWCNAHPVVRWSTQAIGFGLEWTDHLTALPSTTIWSNLPPPYTEVGGYYFVTNESPCEVRAFRLMKP